VLASIRCAFDSHEADRYSAAYCVPAASSRYTTSSENSSFLFLHAALDESPTFIGKKY
jgi:hypothetical protein